MKAHDDTQVPDAPRIVEILAEEADASICATCGTQFPSGNIPARCPVCDDERQYVLPEGQRWTTIERLADEGHHNEVRELEPDLFGLGTTPSFAIGQRALVVRTPDGNMLWDSVSLVDEESIHRLGELGGVRAIAVSHPHFYTSMVAWSRVLGDVPIFLPDGAQEWIARPKANIVFYGGGAKELFGGISLHRTGGHFPCSQVALWSAGAQGRGAILSADEPTVTPGGDRVSFMHSFPNLIPLDEDRLRRVAATLSGLQFDRIYSGWWGKVVRSGAKDVVRKSVQRYLRALGADGEA